MLERIAYIDSAALDIMSLCYCLYCGVSERQPEEKGSALYKSNGFVRIHRRIVVHLNTQLHIKETIN